MTASGWVWRSEPHGILRSRNCIEIKVTKNSSCFLPKDTFCNDQHHTSSLGSEIMRFVSKTLAVLVMGAIAVLAVSPLAGALGQSGNSTAIFVTVLGIVAIVAIFAKSGRRAWGWGALINAMLFIALPVSTLLLSGAVANEMITEASGSDTTVATAVGATVGSGLLVGASAFFGFIFGAIFVVLGLVLTLGGAQEVVVVDKV